MRTAALFLAALIVASEVAAQAPAGRLLQLKGTWTRKNSGLGPLRPGVTVFAGEELRATTADAGAELMLYSGRALVCLAVCNIPDEAPPKQPLLQRLFGKAAPPPAVAFTIARGGTVTDAVLLYQAGQLDLQPALGLLDSAKYTIVLRNLRRDERPTSFDYEWRSRNAQPATLSISPGLFELTAISPERADLGPAVVYIADPRAYPASRQSFEEAQALVTSAVPRLSEIARRQFVLAVLDSQP